MTDDVRGPTSGEILRRLDEQARATERVVARLDLLAEKLEERYLPRGEYNAHRQADQQRITELEKDAESQSAFRRQVVGGIIVGALLFIFQTVVTITVLRGGI